MARAYPHTDAADPAPTPDAGEWQALRGELVALLDKVESRYGAQAEPEPAGAALAQRVRNLRDQVAAPEPNLRRREALRSVKRAVDRFSERDGHEGTGEDELSAAIAEIRRRQGPALGRRATDMPDFHELSALVNGMSLRLERLEGDLKGQRADAGAVHEVASQVEQLTQVVELLAGAVGETGQVKRLESQIAALGMMIEDAARPDLGAVNQRLDDVAATVGKLAQLQAEQMEREIAREAQRAARPEPGAELGPAMHAIEAGVRNVYDRIDAIERSVALSAGDFEKLTGEMAAFTQAMQAGAGAPAVLVERVDALTQRLAGVDGGSAEVAALKHDIAALRQAVLEGMEPRFSHLESRIEALSERLVPTDTTAVESQLRTLMARMDSAGAQLDGLAGLYAATSEPDFDSLATMVAERTSEAVARQAPPVAMFGPDSLKSIEDRITGLIKSAGKTPDYETLAELVATRTSEAVARTAGSDAKTLDPDGIAALEQRMTAVLNTAGKETAERLARLEAALAGAATPAAAFSAPAPVPAPAQARPAAAPERATARLDSILAGLAPGQADSMPANPADDAPLIDPGFGADPTPRAAPAARPAEATPPAAASEHARPHFDPAQVERPPRPRSSLGGDGHDPFAPVAKAETAAPELVAAPASSTSTFVAAARRAQRARQEQAETAAGDAGGSLFARALTRVRAKKANAAETPAVAEAPDSVALPVPEAVAEDRPARFRWSKKAAKPAPVVGLHEVEDTEAPLPLEDGAAQAGFLTRHRRPLLLAATLVAVSMLALNLMLQRMHPPVANPPVSAVSATAGSTAVPPPTSDRVDPVATESINPGAPMSFSRMPAKAPLPPTLPAAATPGTSFKVPSPADSAATPAATAPAPAELAESFELPPEAVGPEPLRQAAADGDARAQFEVAAIYTEGRVVAQDLAEAAKWYERAAAHDFVPAQYRLGNLYEAGTGVEKDLDVARLWYQRAADAGNRMAMHNLAALYAGGQLGEQQFELAAQWFEKAAERGMTDSQFNLGMLYARGLGVEQDFETSYKWFALAARSGDKDAAQARDDIAKSLTAEAVGRIGTAIEGWRPLDIELAANFAPIGTWTPTFDPGEAITSKDVVGRVQAALTRLGFDVGAADGVAGPKTAQAIRAFEQGTGMSQSGQINPRLLAVLGSQPV